jgi:DNA-3-methyladenine glycosylase II
MAQRKTGKPRAIATTADIRAGMVHLRRGCATMRRLHDAIGDPPLRRELTGFPGLARVVVGQQLSIASANSIWSRLAATVVPFEANRLMETNDEALKCAGLSRGKIRTLRAISLAVSGGSLDFDDLASAPEPVLREALTALSGIVPWTADIYMMFCLGRSDAFAPGDLALQVSAQSAFALSERPTAGEFEVIAERWRPYRAVAARLLWAFYAHERGR